MPSKFLNYNLDMPPYTEGQRELKLSKHYQKKSANKRKETPFECTLKGTSTKIGRRVPRPPKESFRYAWENRAEIVGK